MARIIDASLSAGDGAGCDPRALHGEWGRLDAASRRGLAYTPQVKAETDALYYVADGTGGHVFARTLEEHNANVRKWRAIRRARGEM